MSTLKRPGDGPQRRVWRISADAPLGKIVDPTAEAGKAPPPPQIEERVEASWARSSHDLLNGLEVSETDPGEFDSLFRPPPAAPQRAAPDSACRPCPPDVSQDQWMMRFAIRLAELDLQADPREVIGIARSLWPARHHLAPEDVARFGHEHGWSP